MDKVDAKIIPLNQLYLTTLAAFFAAEGLQTVQQDLTGAGTNGEEAGRLWFVRAGTTVPDVFVQYRFGVDQVVLGVMTRDERKLDQTVKYAEGLDGFGEELMKFMQANRLAAPKKKAA